MAKLSDEKEEYPEKRILVSKILTEEVLAKFARRDEERKIFRQKFERACLNVFGTTSPLLRYNLLWTVDDSYNEQSLFNWKVDCGLIVQAFFG